MFPPTLLGILFFYIGTYGHLYIIDYLTSYLFVLGLSKYDLISSFTQHRRNDLMWSIKSL